MLSMEKTIAEVTDAQVVGLQDAADRDACAAAVNSSAIVASAAADFHHPPIVKALRAT